MLQHAWYTKSLTLLEEFKTEQKLSPDEGSLVRAFFTAYRDIYISPKRVGTSGVDFSLREWRSITSMRLVIHAQLHQEVRKTPIQDLIERLIHFAR
jgi:hypothetical protein